MWKQYLDFLLQLQVHLKPQNYPFRGWDPSTHFKHRIPYLWYPALIQETKKVVTAGHVWTEDPWAPPILQASPKRKDILSPPSNTPPSTRSLNHKKKADIQHTDLMFSMHLPSDKHTNAFCWAFSLLTFLNRNINAQKKKEPSAVGNDTKYKPWVKTLCFSSLPLNKLLQKFQNTFPMQLPAQLIVSQFYLIFFWEWHTTLTPEPLQMCGKDPTQAMLLLATTIKNLTSGE